MKYLWAKHPKVADEFASATNDDTMKHLPEHVSDMAGPRSLRASDENVKTNVEDASMDLDKFVRGGVLERLIQDLQELDYEKKLKPRMLHIEMGTEGGKDMGEMMPGDEEDAAEAPETPGEEPDEEDMGEGDEEEGPSNLDPRLKKLISAKRKGKK